MDIDHAVIGAVAEGLEVVSSRQQARTANANQNGSTPGRANAFLNSFNDPAFMPSSPGTRSRTSRQTAETLQLGATRSAPPTEEDMLEGIYSNLYGGGQARSAPSAIPPSGSSGGGGAGVGGAAVTTAGAGAGPGGHPTSSAPSTASAPSLPPRAPGAMASPTTIAEQMSSAWSSSVLANLREDGSSPGPGTGASPQAPGFLGVLAASSSSSAAANGRAPGHAQENANAAARAPPAGGGSRGAAAPSPVAPLSVQQYPIQQPQQPRQPFHALITQNPQQQAQAAIKKPPIEQVRSELGVAISHLFQVESMLQGANDRRRKELLLQQIEAHEIDEAKLLSEVTALRTARAALGLLGGSSGTESKGAAVSGGGPGGGSTAGTTGVSSSSTTASSADGAPASEGEMQRVFAQQSTSDLRVNREFLQGQISRIRKILDERSSNLEEQSMCCVCFVNDRSVLLRPCSHLALCATCSTKVDSCPICRARITGRINVKIS